MPITPNTPPSTSAVDRLALEAANVRGAQPSSYASLEFSCFEAEASKYGSFPFSCFEAEASSIPTCATYCFCGEVG